MVERSLQGSRQPVGRKMSLAVMLGALACGRVGFDGDGGIDEEDAAGSRPGDGDGDGIADGTDNCPAVTNPGQANEDTDRFGDACDPCPPYADGDPVIDQDADGVSDACDPFPARAGDQITMFEGFSAAPAGASMRGTWKFTGGGAVSTSSLDEVGAVAWTVAASGRQTIAAAATIDQMFGSLNARPVGVVQRFDDGAADGVIDGLLCVFGINPSDKPVFAVADNRFTQAFESVPATAAVGSTSTFTLTEEGITYACDGSAATRPLTTTSSRAATPNRVGLFTRSASAHFAWAMIIASP